MIWASDCSGLAAVPSKVSSGASARSPSLSARHRINRMGAAERTHMASSPTAVSWTRKRSNELSFHRAAVGSHRAHGSLIRIPHSARQAHRCCQRNGTAQGQNGFCWHGDAIVSQINGNGILDRQPNDLAFGQGQVSGDSDCAAPSWAISFSIVLQPSSSGGVGVTSGGSSLGGCSGAGSGVISTWGDSWGGPFESSGSGEGSDVGISFPGSPSVSGMTVSDGVGVKGCFRVPPSTGSSGPSAHAGGQDALPINSNAKNAAHTLFFMV